MKQKHYLIIGLLAIIGIVFISSCVKQTPKGIPKEATITANLDNQFQLKTNQIASIENENLKIEFLNITEDSRCPSDVICVWAGQVTAVINIFKNDQNLGDFSLTSQAGKHEDSAIKYFDEYSIKLIKVEPYPKSTQKIEISDYIVTLVVSKVVSKVTSL